MKLSVLGIRRSGNHAIINWILEPVASYIFLNNVRDYEDADIWDSCEQIYLKGIPYFVGKRRFLPFFLHRYIGIPLFSFEKNDVRLDRDKLKLFASDNFLVSQEDRPFSDLKDLIIEDERPDTREPSRRILILRNPLNLFASLIRSGRVEKQNLSQYVELWCDHARAYISFQDHWKTIICLKYDEWVARPRYRAEIADRIGIALEVESTGSVARVGGGSSFDGVNHLDQADKMQVLTRWKDMLGNSLYTSIFNRDSELTELMLQIFENSEELSMFRCSIASPDIARIDVSA